MSCHINISTTEVRKEFRNSWYKRKSVKFNGRWRRRSLLCLLLLFLLLPCFHATTEEYIFIFLIHKRGLGSECRRQQKKYTENTLIRTFNLRCFCIRIRRDFNFAIENNYPSRLYTHVNALFYVLILSRCRCFPLCLIFCCFWYGAINKMKAVQWLNFKTSSLSVNMNSGL